MKVLPSASLAGVQTGQCGAMGRQPNRQPAGLMIGTLVDCITRFTMLVHLPRPATRLGVRMATSLRQTSTKRAAYTPFGMPP